MKSSRNTIRKVAYAATMLASASIAFASFGATDWYVDGKDGDNGNSGTSPTSAFKTIARAVQALSANGDSINIADCDTPYAISKTIVPTFNCRIRSISGNPEKVVIDAGGQCPCLRVPYTATAADNKVVSVCGITFRNGESTSTEAPVSINGAAWSFEAGGIAGSRYTMVSNCVVESCRMRLVGNVDLSARRFSGGGIGLCGYSSSSNVGKPVSGYPDIIPGVFDTIVTNCSVFCSLQNTSTARLSVCGGGVGIAFAAARGLQVLGCGASNTCNRADSYSCNGGGLLVGQGARVEQSVVRGCRVDRVPGQTGEQNKDGLASGGGVAFQCSNGDNDTGVLRDSLIEENVSTGATGGGVYAYSFMRLVGCTVRKNRIDSPVTTDSSYCGGTAIYMDSVKNNAEISNCVIEQNEDVTTAGGHSGSVVFFYGTEKMTLRDSVVRNNTGYTASALKFFNVNGSVVTNCVVSGNVSTGPVGPLLFYNNKSLCIQECAFVSNRSDTASAAASANGNGIIYFSNGSNPVYSNIVIRSSLFLGNEVFTQVGWLYMINCLKDANVLSGYEPMLFENCSFVGNRNRNNDEGMGIVYLTGKPAEQHVKTKGCVFADNQTAGGGHPGFYGPVADWDITYSFSDGGESDAHIWGKQWIPVTAENHNINGALVENDPKFVNPGAGNFRPGRKSSCLVDAGGPFEPWMGTGKKNSTLDMGDGSFTLDKVGTYGVAIIRNNAKPRRFGSAVDMGCFEFKVKCGLIISVY